MAGCAQTATKYKTNLGSRTDELETKDVTFDQKISASYTATFGDAAYGPTRLKLANEGSIRENIRQFIEKLLLLRVNKLCY